MFLWLATLSVRRVQDLPLFITMENLGLYTTTKYSWVSLKIENNQNTGTGFLQRNQAMLCIRQPTGTSQSKSGFTEERMDKFYDNLENRG